MPAGYVFIVQEQIINTLNTHPTSSDLNSAIDRLCSRNASVRAEAQKALQNLTPEQIDELVLILRAEPKKMIGRMGIWFAIMAWPMVFGPAWLTFGHAGGLPAPMATLLFLGFLAGYMLLFPKLVAKPRLQDALFYCTLAIKDTRMLGPLLSRSTFPATKANRFANGIARRLYRMNANPADTEQAVVDLIECVGAEDDIDLTKMEWGSLRILLRSKGPAVALPLIKVIAIAGGSSELATLRALSKGAYPAGSSPEVREAAAACIETLEERISRQQVPDTLLRASQESTPSGMLVRPAATVAPADEANLLRYSQASAPGAAAGWTPTATVPQSEATVVVQSVSSEPDGEPRS